MVEAARKPNYRQLAIAAKITLQDAKKQLNRDLHRFSGHLKNAADMQAHAMRLMVWEFRLASQDVAKWAENGEMYKIRAWLETNQRKADDQFMFLSEQPSFYSPGFPNIDTEVLNQRLL